MADRQSSMPWMVNLTINGTLTLTFKKRRFATKAPQNINDGLRSSMYGDKIYWLVNVFFKQFSIKWPQEFRNCSFDAQCDNSIWVKELVGGSDSNKPTIAIWQKSFSLWSYRNYTNVSILQHSLITAQIVHIVHIPKPNTGQNHIMIASWPVAAEFCWIIDLK